MIHIMHNVKRLSAEIINAYRNESSATIHEAMGRRGAINSTIHQLAPGMKVVGNALTVRCHSADNIMLIKAINMAQPGDVIVADMGGAPMAGPFGEVAATECVVKKVAGLVLNSCIRDTKEVVELGFPVFCVGKGISGTAKATLGTINHPIAFGDQIICPGDLILGDADGLVVVAHDEVDEVLKLSQQRTKKEAKVMEKLRNGESLFDLYGYQEVLDRLGCIEE